MSWGGVDLIQRRPGESDRSAIDRLYGPDDELLPDDADVTALYEVWDAEQRSTLTTEQLRWRDNVLESLEQLRAGWRVVESPDDDVPLAYNVLRLEHPDLVLSVSIGAFWANLNVSDRRPAAANENDLWWDVIERLGNEGCLMFVPDGGDTIERSEFRTFAIVA